MIDLDDVDIDEDGILTATVELPGERHVTIESFVDDVIDVEGWDLDEDEDEDDLGGADGEDERAEPDGERIRAVVEHALARLSEEVLDAREQEVAARVGADELVLDAVLVSDDGMIVLLYLAPEQSPSSTVRCVLDDDLDIDAVVVD